MNSQSSHKQRGVVLIFSLVMLLLITLVGVNMIQQNRLQFMMAANAQEQTTIFASAEDVLDLAENYIGGQRYTAWPLPNPIPSPVGTTYTCNKSTPPVPGKFTQLIPGDITGSLDLSAATIASGLTASITQTACMSIAGVESVCTPDPSESSGWSASELQCNQSDPAKCSTEVYTIRITAPNPTTGSQRIVESKYAVRCDM